jgi:hypothetical protein
MVEFAAIVSEALEAAGITATLSGGAAVSAYTENRYESKDLFFVTTALVDELKSALEPLGFSHAATPRLSVFDHPEAAWYLEFPPAPLAFGGLYVDVGECTFLETAAGAIRIITPTHSVMDRLIAGASWQDAPALDQAILVASHQRDSIDWDQIDAWVLAEGIASTPEIRSFYRSVQRSLP